MKICVFQGTFNPIHNAHLRIADFACKNFHFDKFIFIPAYIPPHKEIDLDLAAQRLQMVRLALESYPEYEVSDIEYKRGGKSYTYDTITALYDLYDTEEKINFIIGTDAFEKIESWYRIEDLKQLIKFLVFVREDNFDVLRYNYLREKGYDFELQNLPYRDISSTELREKIRTNSDIEKYVPPKVKEYIEKYGLYKS